MFCSGYIRAFLLLVGMHPATRVFWAASLDIDLITRVLLLSFDSSWCAALPISYKRLSRSLVIVMPKQLTLLMGLTA